MGHSKTGVVIMYLNKVLALGFCDQGLEFRSGNLSASQDREFVGLIALMVSATVHVDVVFDATRRLYR
jgi:hypothetical protein